MQLSTLWIFDHCYYYYDYLGVRSIGKFRFHLDLRISNQTKSEIGFCRGNPCQEGFQLDFV